MTMTVCSKSLAQSAGGAGTKSKTARIDLDYSLTTIVGYRLKRAYMVFKDDYASDPSLKALTKRQFTVLSLTASQCGISQSDLARQLGIERSGMVQLVDQLETKGYLRRVSNPEDRRVYRLEVTKAGHERLNQHHHAVVAHEQRVLAGLNKKEQALLLSLLDRIPERG